jgi:hypothetical protein
MVMVAFRDFGQIAARSIIALRWADARLRRKNWLSKESFCYKHRSNVFDGSGESSPETVFFCVRAGGSRRGAG